MIDPISANIFVNQNAPVAAAKLGDLQNRFELQAVQALKALNEKDIEIQELRPTEESHMLDPDREHEREKNDTQEHNRIIESELDEHGADENNTPTTGSSEHLIDIKV
jgi:hypothetical protein